jgi:redox-sensing transcriptional repressor
MRHRRIPEETIGRLPLYLRSLLLLKEAGERRVSSRALADKLHVNPAIIRKDLSHFGDFGTPGVGYYIETLIDRLRSILKLHKLRQAALVGAGKVGAALLNYPGFAGYGFEIAAVFDNDPRKIGRKLGQVTVEDVSKLGSIKARDIRLAIIAVPASAASRVADGLIEAGIGGILNFAPCHLEVPRRVKVINIDIAMALGSLQYYI